MAHHGAALCRLRASGPARAHLPVRAHVMVEVTALDDLTPTAATADETERNDVLELDREAWNLPAPKIRPLVRGLRGRARDDGRAHEHPDVPELEPAA